ncbi:MAG: Rab family GTPase [Candidatus Kariarchaeaceae archaeon]
MKISYQRYKPKRNVYKLTLLGDGGVGKTSLRHRYLGEGFKQNYMATIGADFAIKRLDEEGNNIVQIWDLAGQPRFSIVREGYYIGTKGAILVYDISRPETFYSIPNWIAELMDNLDDDEPPPMALVGNKADLREEQTNFITVDQGEDYAKELGEWAELEIPHIETSAKTGLNVNKMFKIIVDNINYRQGHV